MVAIASEPLEGNNDGGLRPPSRNRLQVNAAFCRRRAFRYRSGSYSSLCQQIQSDGSWKAFGEPHSRFVMRRLLPDVSISNFMLSVESLATPRISC